jgi:hypothetical protein
MDRPAAPGCTPAGKKPGFTKKPTVDEQLNQKPDNERPESDGEQEKQQLTSRRAAQNKTRLTAAEVLRKNHEIQQKKIIALFRLGVPTACMSTRYQNLKSLYLNGL